MSESTSPKSRIKDKFLLQLSNTPYEKITVTKIASAAGMSRRNVYKHYSSKEEILSDLVQEKLELFFDIFEVFYLDKSPEKWDSVNKQILAVVTENKSLIAELVKDDANFIVYSNLKSAIARALGHVARINNITIKDRAFFEVYTEFLASASYSSTKSWIYSGNDVAGHKLVILLKDLFNDGITEKLRLCDT